ncbi:MAG: hypothetical protein FJZ87_02925 [Chloroflexi bacterium]|nr:hypothetical protein [Chloroflexota bacterium]
MTTYRRNFGDGLKMIFRDLFRNRQVTRGAVWGLMIVGALLAFEVFNFSTTQFALRDMLGDLTFGGMRWATILAIAFCGIDFAGIARIFTPEQGRDEPAEIYYLFGAWLLAAGFNATLTWWGVSVAIQNNANLQSNAVLSAETLTTVVPLFVAAMVWLVRVLIIGTFSLAGDRLFSTAAGGRTHYSTQRPYLPTSEARPAYQSHRQVNQPIQQPVLRPASQINRPMNAGLRPAPKPMPSQQTAFLTPEPTYHPVTYGARSQDNFDRHYDA